jgi:LacI family transcriptional regulator
MSRGRRKQGATIVDIAKKLGLSPMTVSRALTGNREVSDATRKRVLKCAAAVGYQPNRWARSLVTRRSSLIGVVIPDISHSFFAEITCGVEEVVEKEGYDILLCHSRGSIEKEKDELATLVGSRVDGLIIASVQPERSPELFTKLKDAETPFVLVDRFFPKANFPSVRVDDCMVGRLATECLIELGHSSIAHIAGSSVSPASLRRRGFVGALKAHGLAASPHWTARGDFGIESGRAAMKRLLQTTPRPTAVFAANDPMAIGAVYACREAGLRVPQDISIIGAGNIEGPHHPTPFLTTIDWPREELGRVAAELLLAMIKNRDRQEVDVKVFDPRLLIRQSTAAPPRRTGEPPAPRFIGVH